MASASSKSLPTELDRFLHGHAFDTHRDLHLPQTGSSSGSIQRSTFRSGRPAWPDANGDGDQDFGRFAAGGEGVSPWHRHPGGDLPFRPFPSTGSSASALHEADGLRRSAADGDAVQALLASSSMTDTLHGDWESELFSSRVSPTMSWKREMEGKWQLDDYLTSRTGRAGKGKAREGNVSPVSADMIASLSTMDAASRSYLRDMLAQRPHESITEYLAKRTYSEDVWGVPMDVKKLLDQATKPSGEGDENVGTKEKAIRRLQLVLRHLTLDSTTPVEGFPSPVTPAPPVEKRMLQDKNSPSSSLGSNSARPSPTTALMQGTNDFRLLDSPLSTSIEGFSNAPLFSKTSSATSDVQHMKASGVTERLDQPIRAAQPASFAARGDSWGNTDGEDLVVPSEPLAPKHDGFDGRKTAEGDAKNTHHEADLPPFQVFLANRLQEMARRSGGPR